METTIVYWGIYGDNGPENGNHYSILFGSKRTSKSSQAARLPDVTASLLMLSPSEPRDTFLRIILG